MNNDKAVSWGFLAAVAVAAVAAFFLVRQYQAQQAPVTAAVPAPPAQRTAIEEQTHHPIEQALQQQSSAAGMRQPAALPALEQSDDTVGSALAELIGQGVFEELFYRTTIVHRLVATIDNLPRESVALRLLPVKPATGTFAVTGNDNSLAIAADNYARYAPFVRLAQAVDAHRLVAVYVRFYPLFQQAYRELGYPNGYFNDRLVEVIDQLLKAPEVQGPVRLIQPHVLYQYADPELEALSAGQKIMVRMGSANAAVIKAKLTEIRQQLVGQALRQ